jgi:hypothetical protein
MSVSRAVRPHGGAERWVLAMIGLEFAAALIMSVAGSPEGWLGGLLFGLLYAAPVLVLFLLLRAPRPALARSAGLIAVPLAFAYIALPIANWTGYHTAWEAARAVLVTAPAVVACFVLFAAGLNHSRR